MYACKHTTQQMQIYLLYHQKSEMEHVLIQVLIISLLLQFSPSVQASNLCSSSRKQPSPFLPKLPKFSHILLPTLHWLPVSVQIWSLGSCYLPTVLQLAQGHPTSRTGWNQTPQPFHIALLLPTGLLLQATKSSLSDSPFSNISSIRFAKERANTWKQKYTIL